MWYNVITERNSSEGGYNISKIGYVRVSSETQDTARQLAIMQEYEVDKVFEEKASGKNTERAELKKMLDYVREGDVLYIESISRLSRSVRDLLRIVDKLNARGVELVSHKENIDTITPQGRFVLSIFGALSELEREQTLQRQREGIAIAKAEGKYKGRQRIQVDEELFKKLYKKWKAGEITAVTFQKKIGLIPNTFYRRVKRFEKEGAIN